MPAGLPKQDQKYLNSLTPSAPRATGGKPQSEADYLASLTEADQPVFDRSGFTAEQAAAAAAAEPETKPGIVSSVKRGAGGALANIARAGEDLGIPLSGVREYGESVVEANPAEVTSLGDIPRKPLQFLKETAGELVAPVGLSMAGAATGAGLGGLVGGPVGAGIGGVIGAFTPSAAQSYGEIRSGQDEAGVDERGRALLAAGLSGALDTASPVERVGRRLVTSGLKKGGLGFGKHTLLQGAAEAGTEGAQEYIEDVGKTGSLEGPGAQQLLMAGAKGFAGGTVAGAVEHVAGRDKTQNIPEPAPPEPEAAPGEPTQLLLPAPTAEKPLLLTDQRPDRALPAPAPAALPAPEDRSVIAAGAPEAEGPPAAPGPRRPTGNPIAVASGLLRNFEGFREGAYWDVNHWRTGYGSDTVTDENGNVRATRQGDVVDRAGAERDLQRRLSTQFLPAARKAAGPAFDNLDSATQAALLSVTYNYGHLPQSVAAAVRTGDNERIAAAVEKLQNDNDGVNRRRRLQEAQVIRGGSSGGGLGGGTVSPGAELTSMSQSDILKMIEEMSGSKNDQQAEVLSQALAGSPDAATAALKAERERIEQAYASLAENANRMLPDTVREQEARLAQQERVFSAAVDTAERIAKARGPTLVTEPGPLDTSRIPGPQANPELEALGDSLMMEGQVDRANALSARGQLEQRQALAQQEQAERAFALKDLLRDRAVANPRADFLETMRNMGLSEEISPAEELQLKRRESFLMQQARRDQAAALERQRAETEAEAARVAPEQDTSLGVPERVAPPPVVEPEPEPAPPVDYQVTPRASPEERALQNIRDRSEEEVSADRSPVTAKWFRQGVKAALGDEDALTPTTNKGGATNAFNRGKQFVEKETARQVREMEANTPIAPASRPTQTPAQQKQERRTRAVQEATARAEKAKEEADARAAAAAKRKATAEAKKAAAPKTTPAAEQAKAASVAKEAPKAAPKTEAKPKTTVMAEKAKAASVAKAEPKPAPKPEPAPKTEAKTAVEKNLERDQKTETADEKTRRGFMERINAAEKSGAITRLDAKALRDQVTDTDRLGRPVKSTADLGRVLDNVLGPAGGKARRASQPPIAGMTPAEIKRYWDGVKAAAQKELNRVGLGNVDLKFFRQLPHNAQGIYSAPDESWTARHTIALGLDHDGQLETLDHEIIHALREMNLITDREWSILADVARRDRRVDHVDTTYADESASVREEERVAELYRLWATDKDRVTGAMGRIFAKVRRFFDAIGRAWRGEPTLDADTVMQAILSGEIGRRRQGATRGEMGLRAGKEGETLAVDPTVLRPPLTPEQEADFEAAVGRYSKAPAGGAQPGSSARMDTPQSKAKQAAANLAGSNVAQSSTEFGKKLHLWMSSTKDLASIAAKWLPSAQKLIDAHSASHADSREFQEAIWKIKDRYQKLPFALRGNGPGSINALVRDSTSSGKWAFQPVASKDGYSAAFVKQAKVDPELAKRHAEMKAKNPDAAKIVEDMFLHNYKARQKLGASLTQAIDAEFDPQIDAASDPKDKAYLQSEKAAAMANATRIFDTQGGLPYSPLKRIGKWAVVGKSAEYEAAEQANNRKLMDKLSESPDHYYVNFVDTIGEAEKLRKNVETKFGDGAYKFERTDDAAANAAVPSSEMFMVFKRMQNAIEGDGTLNARAQRNMTRLARDLYLMSLAENSALKAELGRKNVSSIDPVTGEGVDMMRAFVTHGNAMANHIASVSNNVEVQDALTGMAKELNRTKGAQRTDAQRVYNDLMYRYTTNLGVQPNRAVDRIAGMTSFMTLLSSPAYYLQNATQTAMITQPLLASRYGYTKSAGAIRDAYKDFFTMTKGKGLDPRDGFKDAPADLKKLMEHLVSTGRVDAGYTDDLGHWELDGDGAIPTVLNRGDRFIRKASQYVEIMNRTTAGIAAYRLGIKNGLSPDAAMKAAGKIIDETHGDYSGFNTPSAITAAGSFGKIALQFRKFQLIQAALVVREFNRAFKGATKEEKWAGRKALGFLGAQMAAVGGVVAMPGANTIGWIIGTLLDMTDQDDDWDDWRHNLREWFGAGKEGDNRNMLADFLYKGAPYALGVDLSDKLGMGNIFALAPYIGVEEALDSPQKMAEVTGRALSGPTGGMAGKMIGGFGWGMEPNDWSRIIQGMSPAIVANVAKSARVTTEGVKAKGGETYIPPEDIGVAESLMLAIGFTPRQLANQSEKGSERFDADAHYKSMTTQMKRAYTEAVDSKDPARIAEVRAQWDDLQAARKSDHYAVQPLSTLLKAPRERDKRQKAIIDGVPSSKANREFVEEMAAGRSFGQDIANMDEDARAELRDQLEMAD